MLFSEISYFDYDELLILFPPWDVLFINRSYQGGNQIVQAPIIYLESETDYRLIQLK